MTLRVASINQDAGIDPARKKGAAVHLAAMREAMRSRGAEVLEIDEPDERRLRWRLDQAWRGASLSLVYERYAVGRGVAAAMARWRGVPYVLEVNAPLADEARRWRAGDDDAGAMGRDRALFEAASCVLAVSSAVAEYAVRRGADPALVHIVPNAVDPRRFLPRAPDDPVRRALVPEGRFALGFHGRLRPWHGFDLLARATATLIERGAPVHLVAVGEGDFELDLAGLVPADRYTLVGWRRHDEVGRCVAAFDALPLTYPPELPCYFSPLKLREAMACAVVPVVPALGDLPRIVRHEVDGLVYPAGDAVALVAALETLLRDAQRRERLARTARLASEHDTWERIADLALAHAMPRAARSSWPDEAASGEAELAGAPRTPGVTS
jgi:glycosyltransferase involved in cell wall biosynthesis